MNTKPFGIQELPVDPRIFNRRKADGTFPDISEFFAVDYESVPWCGKYDHAIDYELVKVRKPKCCENGCAGCSEQYQKQILKLKARKEGKNIKKVIIEALKDYL